MTINYWFVQKDHLFSDEPDVLRDDSGYGFYDEGWSWERVANMRHADVVQTFPIEFQLYDDDDEIYYSGRMTTLDVDETEAFRPLDWAERHAGCTVMRVRERNGVWKWL